MAEDLWIENSEVRFHGDGTVDEIVVRDSAGNCLLHMEQMDDTCFWIGLYPTSGEPPYAIHLWVGSKNGRSFAECKVTDAGSATTTPSPLVEAQLKEALAKSAPAAKEGASA